MSTQAAEPELAPAETATRDQTPRRGAGLWVISIFAMLAFWILVWPVIAPAPSFKITPGDPDATTGNVLLNVDVLTLGRRYHIRTDTGATAHLQLPDGSTTHIGMWCKAAPMMQLLDSWDPLFAYPRRGHHALTLSPPPGTLDLFCAAHKTRIDGEVEVEWVNTAFYIFAIERLSRGTFVHRLFGPTGTRGIVKYVKTTRPFSRDYGDRAW